MWYFTCGSLGCSQTVQSDKPYMHGGLKLRCMTKLYSQTTNTLLFCRVHSDIHQRHFHQFDQHLKLRFLSAVQVDTGVWQL